MVEKGILLMDSVDKLRTAARNMAKGRNLENHEECNLFLIIADEIETELAANYYKLPLDADGIPTNVGDEMTCHGHVFTVCAVAPARIHEWATTGPGKPRMTVSYEPEECTHYHAPTIEDLLRDFAFEMNDNLSMYVCESFDADEREAADRKTIAKYAERLREVLADE